MLFANASLVSRLRFFAVRISKLMYTIIKLSPQYTS